jgi:hypothetical protein
MKIQNHLENIVDNFCQKKSPEFLRSFFYQWRKITSPPFFWLILDRCFPNEPSTIRLEDSR